MPPEIACRVMIVIEVRDQEFGKTLKAKIRYSRFKTRTHREQALSKRLGYFKGVR
jgi:hypothetical protein